MSNFNKYKNVFQPLKVGNMVVKNRIQFAPLVSCHAAASGEVTPELVEFLGYQARTGAGIVTIGATAVDAKNGEDFLGALSITKETDLPGLSLLADEVHRYGAKISIELNHAGRAVDLNLLEGDAVAASPIPLGPDFKSRYIKELDQEGIDKIVNQFAECAERLMRAGFDMVMIHGAHGNLIGSFLSPLANKRTDHYGGSLANRMRFPLEVLRAVRERCGDKLNVEYRISGDELHPEGQRTDEVIEFLKVAQEYIDLVNVSAGLVVMPGYNKQTMPPIYGEYAPNVKYAEAIKKAISIPVATVAGIPTIAMADEIIGEGKADVVAMARALLVDGETVTKAYRGQENETRPCIRCLVGCTEQIAAGKQVRCSINPSVGRETKYRYIRKADRRKKVFVVGGGPAGMMAAQTAMKRGHDVTLFEKTDKLGGALHDAGALEIKSDIRRYIKWDIEETERSGAVIKLNTNVTKELIEEENPHALIIAAGAKPITPPIKGIDGENVYSVSDVDHGKVEVGQTVVVCGGGLSGVESAIALAQQGKDVTVVDMIAKEQFFNSASGLIKMNIGYLLAETGVKLVELSKIQEITEEGVKVINKNWQESVLKADTVINALGYASRKDVVEELQYLIPETYVVGDCNSVKDIHTANHTAFNYAVEI